MAQPTYDRAFNFSNYQARNPGTPLPASHLDAELNRVKQTADQLGQNLSFIQRDDGALANGSVGRDQLSADLSLGFNAPTLWATETRYTTADTVFQGTGFYQCEQTHVSGVFADDLAADYWTEIADFAATAGAAMAVAYSNASSGLAATNAQAAIDEVALSLAIARAGTPVGAVVDFAGLSAPPGWFFCYGQAVSRTTFPALFAAIGTTYGAGDGSTTFNLPDGRGRVSAGKDNMGGVSADRLTAASGGVDGDTLGASGGSETHTLNEAQSAPHTHTFGATTSSAGSHSHTGSTGSAGSHYHDIEDKHHSAASKTYGDGGTTSAINYATSAQTATTNSSTTAPAHAHTIGADGEHTHTVSGTTSSFGSGQAHNNVQPTLILNKIIFAGTAG